MLLPTLKHENLGEGEEVRNRRHDFKDASINVQHHEPDFEPRQPFLVPATVTLCDFH